MLEEERLSQPIKMKSLLSVECWVECRKSGSMIRLTWPLSNKDHKKPKQECMQFVYLTEIVQASHQFLGFVIVG